MACSKFTYWLFSVTRCKSILCAFELARLGLPLAAVLTFGQPRVGNKNFCDMYDRTLGEITFRIVNQNDIVPRSPLWLGGYRHCGQEIFLEPGTGWGVNPSLWFKLLCDVLGLYGAYRKREEVLIREHFIAAYQDRIKDLWVEPVLKLDVPIESPIQAATNPAK